MYARQDNVTSAIIATQQAAHGVSAGVKIESLAEGQVAFVDAGMRAFVPGVNLANLVAGETYYIIQGMGVGNPVLKSLPIVGGEVTIRKAKYQAPQDQISYVGFNGTAGSLDADDDNTAYLITITPENNDELDRSYPLKMYGSYKTGTGATNSDSAAGLVKSLIKQYNNGTNPVPLIKFERINAGALADAISTFTVDVVKGSKNITFSGDATAIVTDGSILRFGGTGAGTDPVYIVESNDGGAGAARVYTLDVPYQGDTATIVAGEVETVTEGAWGIKMTGLELPYDVDAWRYYHRNKFHVGIGEEFNSTLVSTPQVAREGVGAVPQAKQAEYETWGFSGQGATNTTPIAPRKSITIPSDERFAVISYIQSRDRSGIVHSQKLNQTVTCFLALVNADDTDANATDTLSANSESITGNDTALDV